jgi:imidazolonepropionase-like amidohydrolase
MSGTVILRGLALALLSPNIAAALLLLPAPSPAATTAFVGGTVAIGDGSQPIANGTVVIADGRIVAAGANVKVPSGATIVDAHGKWVSAGLFSGFTQLGIGSYSGVTGLNDGSAPGSALSAAIDVSTAINPEDAPIQVDRAAGITRAVVSPAVTKTIFGGQGAVIDLGTDTDVITRPRAFQYVELDQSAQRSGGGSRPAAYAYFHEALNEAREYQHAAGGGRDWHTLLTRSDAAALVPVLDGKQPLLVQVNRASDILEVLSLKKQYPELHLILFGAAEGWRVAHQIAAAHVPVIAAVGDLPDSYDQLAATESNIGRMTRAGVVVALYSGTHLETYLRQQAARLVAIDKVPGATGLDWGRAFATVTSKPAEALGLDQEIGSLRPGRRADVVVWDGDPLEAVSAAVAVYINGRPQPLDNHLTKLRDRYRDPRPVSLPKAYTH